MRSLNLTLLTDLYEITMMQGYFKSQNQDVVVFDAFYRENPCGGGYAIACGLEQVIDYIKNLQFSADDIRYLQSLNMFDEDFLKYLSTFRFSGSIYAIPEGTVIFPREPFIKVVAPIMEAQLVETAILNIMNHQSLIATKAAASATQRRMTVSWNLVCVVHRDRIPVFTVPALLSSAAAVVLPMYLPDRFSTFRSKVPMHIAGS